MSSGNRFELFEDFSDVAISGGTVTTSIGRFLVTGVGSPAASQPASESGAPGLLRLSTSASTNDTAVLVFEGALAVSQEIDLIEFRIRKSGFGTSNWDVYAGLASVVQVGMGSVGRFVQAEAVNGSNDWESVSAQGGTDKVHTGQLHNGADWQTIRIWQPGLLCGRTEVFGAAPGGNPTYYSAPGVLVPASSGVLSTSRHTAHIVNTGTALQFGFAIQTEAAIARYIDIDYIKITGAVSRGGY